MQKLTGASGANHVLGAPWNHKHHLSHNNVTLSTIFQNLVLAFKRQNGDNIRQVPNPRPFGIHFLSLEVQETFFYCFERANAFTPRSGASAYAHASRSRDR